MSTGESSGLLGPDETAEPLRATGFVHLRGALHASYKTVDFASAAAIVAAAGELAEEVSHHPDVRLGWGSARFEVSSHDAGGVTARDVELARQIDEAAKAAGAAVVPGLPGIYDIAIDTLDPDGIRDFWRAAFDYEESPNDEEGIDLVDPRGVGPKIWFQQMGVARTERNRIHFDVYVTADQAQERVERVLAAAGTLITDEFAPDWWVLADVEGNEVCVCTSGS